jgi:hypothetical protein
MAVDEKLTGRVRDALSHLPDVEEKKMFRGITFMVNSKMCVSVSDDHIMVRFDPAMHEKILKANDCQDVEPRFCYSKISAEQRRKISFLANFCRGQPRHSGKKPESSTRRANFAANCKIWVEMGKRKYKGYVYVYENTIPFKKDLDYWIRLALSFNEKIRFKNTEK